MGTLLEVILEIAVNLLFYSASEELFRKGITTVAPEVDTRPLKFRIFGTMIFSAVAAGLSVWIYPHFIVRETIGRIVTLIVTPLFFGWFMHGRKVQLERKGKKTILINTSTYGAMFAFLYLAVRYVIITALEH